MQSPVTVNSQTDLANFTMRSDSNYTYATENTDSKPIDILHYDVEPTVRHTSPGENIVINNAKPMENNCTCPVYTTGHFNVKPMKDYTCPEESTAINSAQPTEDNSSPGEISGINYVEPMEEKDYLPAVSLV